MFLLFISVKKDLQASETSFADVVKQNAAQELGNSVIQKFVPVFSFVRQGEQERNQLLEQQMAGILPLYGYSRKKAESSTESEEENYLSLDEILLAEAQETEGNAEENKIEENNIEGKTEENTEENTEGTDMAAEDLQELLKAENEAALQMDEAAEAEQVQQNAVQGTAFVRHELQNAVDLQALSSYETLVDTFYTIDGNTMAGSDQLEVSKLLGTDLTISKDGEGPQILVYHTHSQEGFADSIPGDESTTILGVGEYLSEILRNEYGYNVLHHTGKYDVETRDDAYANALPDIERVLAENPTIQVVIDLHRDSMPEETKLVMDLDGRPTARFMFFNGLSRTRKTGNIAYLYNENQEDNLAFSFQMQLKAAEYYPGLTRKIYLKGYRYNMHLRARTTLIELGAQNNTVEEAMNACDPLAHIIDMVLSGEG